MDRTYYHNRTSDKSIGAKSSSNITPRYHYNPLSISRLTELRYTISYKAKKQLAYSDKRSTLPKIIGLLQSSSHKRRHYYQILSSKRKFTIPNAVSYALLYQMLVCGGTIFVHRCNSHGTKCKKRSDYKWALLINLHDQTWISFFVLSMVVSTINLVTMTEKLNTPKTTSNPLHQLFFYQEQIVFTQL